MFDQLEDRGVFGSWIERWRRFRGIDRWPVVDATVTSIVWVDSGDDGYFKISLTYRLPVELDPSSSVSVIVRRVNRGSRYADYKVGDTIPLRAHPVRFDKAVFADISEMETTLIFGLVFSVVGLALLVMRALEYFRGHAK